MYANASSRETTFCYYNLSILSNIYDNEKTRAEFINLIR